MGNFRFKQFEIEQDRCAMKVGTDGVLLGAWAQGGRRILDIGSGTGLISLMMAQRFPEAGAAAAGDGIVPDGNAMIRVQHPQHEHKHRRTAPGENGWNAAPVLDFERWVS